MLLSVVSPGAELSRVCTSLFGKCNTQQLEPTLLQCSREDASLAQVAHTRLALRGSLMVTTRWPKGVPETADLGATTCTCHTSILGLHCAHLLHCRASQRRQLTLGSSVNCSKARRTSSRLVSAAVPLSQM